MMWILFLWIENIKTCEWNSVKKWERIDNVNIWGRLHNFKEDAQSLQINRIECFLENWPKKCDLLKLISEKLVKFIFKVKSDEKKSNLLNNIQLFSHILLKFLSKFPLYFLRNVHLQQHRCDNHLKGKKFPSCLFSFINYIHLAFS